MDEEIEDDCTECRADRCEFDPDYEYDAARFFDFSRPESNSDAREAERWFETAESSPPSPFVVKFCRGAGIPIDSPISSTNKEEGEKMNGSCSNSVVDSGPDSSPSKESTGGLIYCDQVKKKPTGKSPKATGSTLMKPTASHLAKQTLPSDFYSSRRFQRPFLFKSHEKHQHNPLGGIESEATKRQKLESGYLRKITIPQEPDLETARRAQRKRSKNCSDSGEQFKPETNMFKARPLNRKILKAPSLRCLKKSIPQLPEFQEFHLKTTERALQHSSANSTRTHDIVGHNSAADMNTLEQNSADVLKPKKYVTSRKCKDRAFIKMLSSKEDTGVIRNTKQEDSIPREIKFLTDKKLLQKPPTNLFSKLSLNSGSETNVALRPHSRQFFKCSKENVPKTLEDIWLRIGPPNPSGINRSNC